MDDGAPGAARVHEATLIVAAQLGCTLIEARAVIFDRARATDESVEHVSLDVLDGIARFDE